MLRQVASSSPVIIVTLVALLVVKELTTPSEGRFPRILNRVLNIGIVLFMVAFLLIVGQRVAEYLASTT